jgi:hypothetical protein
MDPTEPVKSLDTHEVVVERSDTVNSMHTSVEGSSPVGKVKQSVSAIEKIKQTQEVIGSSSLHRIQSVGRKKLSEVKDKGLRPAKPVSPIDRPLSKFDSRQRFSSTEPTSATEETHSPITTSSPMTPIDPSPATEPTHNPKHSQEILDALIDQYSPSTENLSKSTSKHIMSADTPTPATTTEQADIPIQNTIEHDTSIVETKTTAAETFKSTDTIFKQLMPADQDSTSPEIAPIQLSNTLSNQDNTPDSNNTAPSTEPILQSALPDAHVQIEMPVIIPMPTPEIYNEPNQEVRINIAPNTIDSATSTTALNAIPAPRVVFTPIPSIEDSTPILLPIVVMAPDAPINIEEINRAVEVAAQQQSIDTAHPVNIVGLSPKSKRLGTESLQPGPESMVTQMGSVGNTPSKMFNRLEKPPAIPLMTNVPTNSYAYSPVTTRGTPSSMPTIEERPLSLAQTDGDSPNTFVRDSPASTNTDGVSTAKSPPNLTINIDLLARNQFTDDTIKDFTPRVAAAFIANTKPLADQPTPDTDDYEFYLNPNSRPPSKYDGKSIDSKYHEPEKGATILQYPEKRAGRAVGRPYFLILMSILQIAGLVWSLILNQKRTGSIIQTSPSFNYLIGPSYGILIQMGGRVTPCMRGNTIYSNLTDNQIIFCPPGIRSDYSLYDIENNVTVAGCSLSKICGFGGDENYNPGQWWRFIIPIFLHGGVLHLAFNLGFQIQTGFQLERDIGSWRMAIIYFICGICSFCFSGLFGSNSLSPTTGCSGALYGI